MFAARYGLLFKVDPLLVLEHSTEDHDLLTALYDAAARDMEAR